MAFKKGDKVVFIETDAEVDAFTPKYNEVVTLDYCGAGTKGKEVWALKEYPKYSDGRPQGWQEKCFRPLQTQHTSCHGSKELARQFTEVKEKIESPIKENKKEKAI